MGKYSYTIDASVITHRDSRFFLTEKGAQNPPGGLFSLGSASTQPLSIALRANSANSSSIFFNASYMFCTAIEKE